MNRKLLFHILICALLFAAITVPYTLLSLDSAIPYGEAQASAEAESGITEEDGVIVIGEGTEIAYRPESVYPGETTFIALTGTPNTRYDINVYYPSGVSAAKAFADKFSDENGKVTWEFKVSAKTSAKRLRVVIRSEETYISFYIPVTDL